MLFFFFKQKTAYEMRISDWSSDVCSSDLVEPSTELRTEDDVAPDFTRLMPLNSAVLTMSWIWLRRAVKSLFRAVRELASRPAWRSEERRVGNACVSTCRSRWSQSH